MFQQFKFQLACIVTLLFCPLLPAQWTAGGTPLSNLPWDHVDPKLAAIPGGGFYCAWIAQNPNGEVLLTAIDTVGDVLPGWAFGGTAVSSPGGDYWKTELLADAEGNALVLLYGYPVAGAANGKRHIFIQKLSNNGTALWNGGQPVQVSVDTNLHHLNPFFIHDGEGGAFITWFSTDASLLPSTQDLWVQRIDSNGAVHADWPGLPVALADSAGITEGLPQLQRSPDGLNLYATYITGSVNVRLLMQNLDPATGSFKPGFVRNAPRVLSSGPNIFTNAGREPRLFADDVQNLLVLWPEFRGAGEIYLQKINPAGTAQLTAGGLLVASNPGDDLTYMDALQESDGSLTFAWRISANVTDIIHVKRISNAGAVQWAPDFTTASGSSAYPKLARDGQGGVFLCNKEFGPPDDLVAVRISSAGVLQPGWSLPGSSFGEVGNPDGFVPQRDFRIVEQPNGSAAVVWVKKDTDQLYDVYACNLRSDGSICTNQPMGVNATANSGLRLWPSPAQDEIFVSFPGNEKAMISIFNAAGERMMECVYGESPISVGEWPAGLYLLQWQQGEKAGVVKWVKE